MTPGKIIAGDFAENSALLESGGKLSALAPGFSFKKVQLTGIIQSVELVTEQNKDAFLGPGGWSTAPLSNLGLRALASILSGSNRSEVCFACRLTNGQKFVAIAGRPLYDLFYAEALRAQLIQPVATPSNVISQGGIERPNSAPISPQKAGKSGGQKGCLGCLGAFFVVYIIGAIGSSLSPVTPSSTPAPVVAVATVKPQKPTATPIPTPTETPRKRRRRLAAERRAAREEKEKQDAESAKLAEEQHKRDNPLELLKGTLDFQQGEFTSYITGKVRNNTEETYSYAQINFGLYDSAGNQIGSTLTNVNGLEPGGIWKFKAIVLEDNAANCKVLDITGR